MPTRRLQLESPVVCADGPFGELADVVVDPVGRRVTHLVVQPRHQHGLARLVPIGLAEPDAGDGGAVVLRCTAGEVRGLPHVQEFEYRRVERPDVADPGWDVGIEEVLVLPTADAGGFWEDVAPDEPVAVSYDRIPAGGAELRRGSPVTSKDGRLVGRLAGVELDGHGCVTRLVVERGHLWWRRSTTVPLDAADTVDSDRVVLRLTREELRRR